MALVRELVKQKLFHKIYYVLDDDHLPYGNKTEGQIQSYSSKASELLIEKGVDLILIGCHTATVNSISELRKQFELPFVGVEPYVNCINQLRYTEKDRYGLILTEMTSRSDRLKLLIEKYDPKGRVQIIPLPSFASKIEELYHNPELSFAEHCAEEIDELRSFGLTHLILGCTHYFLVEEHLKKSLDLRTINPSQAVIQQVLRLSSDSSGPVGHSEIELLKTSKMHWHTYDLPLGLPQV